MPSEVSTNLADLPMYFYPVKITREERKRVSFITRGERPKALTSTERRSPWTTTSKEICKEYVNGKNFSHSPFI